MRRRARGVRYPTTRLSDRRWTIPEVGDLQCTRPSGTQLALAAAWKRRPADAHDWSWPRITVDSHDDFCVHDPMDVPLALWCTRAPSLLRLGTASAYRLDFLEVKPEMRGAALGVFTLGLVATRALECGADKLVLAALPQARRLYDSTGGEQRLADGWSAAKGLLPYEFSVEALLALREAIEDVELEG